MLRFALPYRGLLWLAVVGMLFEAAAGAGFTKLLEPVINQTFIVKNTKVAVWLPLAIVGLFVLRGIAGLRDGACLRAWLFGIARRALMDRLRGRYAAPPQAEQIDPDSVPGEDAAPEQALDHAMDLDRLQRGLDRLPLIEREVLSLFYL
ncbi:hypothetical protein AB4084_27750, partial [Lysobacter sp. 2RAB21]